MKKIDSSPIILLVARFLSPFLMVFGWYIIFHGHYSPGGGFQGGAMLAAAILLVRIATGQQIAELQFKKILTTPIGAIGVLIYFGVGLSAMFMGGTFLDYHYVPLPWFEPADLRSFSIVLIEIGVGLAVMAILVSIYDDILESNDD